MSNFNINQFNLVIDNHFRYNTAECDNTEVHSQVITWEKQDEIRGVAAREKKEYDKRRLKELGLDFL